MKNLIILITVLISYNLNAQCSNSLIDGTWVGMGDQLNTAESWSIQLDIKGDNYTILYPSLNCSAELTLKKIEGNIITLKEKINSGKDHCVNNGNVELELINSNTIRYKWSFSNGDPGSFSELIKFN